jgi:hypothetical protein
MVFWSRFEQEVVHLLLLLLLLLLCDVFKMSESTGSLPEKEMKNEILEFSCLYHCHVLSDHAPLLVKKKEDVR